MGPLQAVIRPRAITAPPINRRFEEIFMRGVVMHGPGDVSVEERERPQIVEPTDVILRVPAACICGSDLWPYRGIAEINGPTPMGHEYVGIVEESR
jgi:threonine dehydrogenase-like Zn-dependent dehydrogenase